MSSYGGPRDVRPRRLPAGSWRELLGPKNLGASTVLAGGVALYATNEFLTISLLPSTVAEIGGQRLYAWVTTVYLVASVVAATTVNPCCPGSGRGGRTSRRSCVFGLGSVVCAIAPTMEFLLLGRHSCRVRRAVCSPGLGYAVINSALPQSLWTKASALVSAMWGVGTLVGPAVGGLFAQFGSWRWAFGVLAVADRGDGGAGAGRAAGAPRGATRPRSRQRIPVWSLLLLGACGAVGQRRGHLRATSR